MFETIAKLLMISYLLIECRTTKTNLVYLPFSLTSRLESNFERDPNQPFAFTNFISNRSQSIYVQTQENQFKIARKRSFISYSSEFTNLIDQDSELKLLQSEPVNVEFAHEGGTFIPETNQVWFTANQLPIQNTNITSVDIKSNLVELLSIQPSITTPNGLKYFDGFVYVCSQGNRTNSGAIYSVNPTTLVSQLIVNSWFGLRLNSPNDLTFTKRICGRRFMWFTDPQVAYLQNFGSIPQLPAFVYRFDLVTLELRPVITDLIVPNGIAFDQNETTLYVSDTSRDKFGHGTYLIYAYDINEYGLPINRRVFSVSSLGIPDGIKVDNCGRVWSGEGDGINVRDRSGKLLGVVLGRDLSASGVISNFEIAGKTVIILAQEKLWRFDLKTNIIDPPSP